MGSEVRRTGADDDEGADGDDDDDTATAAELDLWPFTSTFEPLAGAALLIFGTNVGSNNPPIRSPFTGALSEGDKAEEAVLG